MRTKNTFKNMVFGMFSLFLTTIASFVLRTIFIRKLGTDYLGLNGLLTNILSMLSLAELGIGTAIGFSLYKPLSENNTEKIKVLMKFYKKSYITIGIIVLSTGLLLIPFLPYFVKEISTIEHFYLIYILYLVNTAYTYLFSYKRTLINSDQKGYKLTVQTTTFKILLTIFQICYLFIGNNYIIYLLIQLLFGFIENIYINHKINKEYPYLKEKTEEKLSEEEKNNISKNVNGMLFHKIGDYCINGTDNIIMSKFIDLSTVGLYSNYTMIMNCVNSFLITIFNSAAASFGNLISSENEDSVYNKFEIFNFLAFWLYGFSSLAFLFLLNPFIELWFGEEYLIGMSVVLVVIINYYFTSMRVPLGVIKSSAGIYHQDKYIPLIQSLVNLVVSIIAVKKLGLVGIFIGTLVSSILVAFPTRAYFVYKYVFKKKVYYYFVDFFKYFSIIVFEGLIIYIIFDFISFPNLIINFIFKIIIICIIPNLINLIIYLKSNIFKQFIQIVKFTLRRDKYV